MGTERVRWGGEGFSVEKPRLIMPRAPLLCCSLRNATFVSTLISIFKNIFILSWAALRANKKLPRFSFLFFATSISEK